MHMNENTDELGRGSRAHQMLYAILIRPSFSWPVIGATRLNPRMSFSFPRGNTCFSYLHQTIFL